MPRGKLAHGIFEPSNGILESAAFVPGDVQNMGFAGKAAD